MALARVGRGRRTGFLTDAFSLPSFIHELLALLKAEALWRALSFGLVA